VRVTFVTGVSGAGKTTLAETLRDRLAPLDGVIALEIDGPGTPDAGHLDWLRWRAAQLLYEAVTVPAEEGDADHVVICGIVWPHAVIDSNAWPEAEAAKAAVRFLLLDMPHKVIKERLADRLSGKRAGERREILRYNRSLADVLRRQVSQQRTGDILRADRMTPGEIAAYVLEGTL
jgi:ABC-type cobalamin/Fe3+-siderophores transport system ATPase subunit